MPLETCWPVTHDLASEMKLMSAHAIILLATEEKK